MSAVDDAAARIAESQRIVAEARRREAEIQASINDAYNRTHK